MQTKAKRSGWDLTVILFLAVPLDSNIDLRNTHAEVVGSNPTRSIFIYEETTILNYACLDNCRTKPTSPTLGKYNNTVG